MASMPMDQEQQKRRGGGKPPVSAHPAFPAIVALWFAALLGLGSLILPVQLIERMVSATGIASLVPAAAPPLGFTARAAIALAATIFGALLGVVAARRVAGAKRRSADEAYADETHNSRVLSAHDDLDDDGIEAEEYYPDADYQPAEAEGPRTRRRALAMEEEEGPSDFLNVAPLPGVEDDAADVADFDALELGEDIEFTGEFDPEAPAPEAEAESAAETEAPERQEFVAAGNNANDAADDDEDDVEPRPFAFEDRSRNSEPLPFSPPSMARQPQQAEQEKPRPFDAPQDSEAAHQASEEPEEMQEDHVSDQQTFNPVPRSFEAPSEIHDTVKEDAPAPADEAHTQDPVMEEADSDGVGLVQLVQKLGSTLEKHREWSAQRAAAAAPAPAGTATAPEAAPAIPQDFEAARPDDAAEAMAAYFGKPDDTPEAEQPGEAPAPEAGTRFAPLSPAMRIHDDEDEDDEEYELADLAATLSLPTGEQASPSPAPTSVTPTPRPSFDIPPPSAAPAPASDMEEEEHEETTPQGDASYGSLSAVNNPFKAQAQEFVRIDEPEDETPQPAVVFPHQEERKPAPAPAPAENVARPFDRPADAPAQREERQPASNDDNERALREALMNLQRMGK